MKIPHIKWNPANLHKPSTEVKQPLDHVRREKPMAGYTLHHVALVGVVCMMVGFVLALSAIKWWPA